MPDASESIQIIGESLAAFMKTGPQSNSHQDEIKRQIFEVLQVTSSTVDQATANYKQAGEDFLDKAIRVRGMPTRQVSKDGQSIVVSSSGMHIAENFDALIPAIKSCFIECVETYRLQANTYFEQQLVEVNSQLNDFFEQVPHGGTKDKIIKSQITEIKKELRHLVKWDKLFNVYKAASLASEVEFIFSLQSNPIAAIWHYSQLDTQGEYQKNYDHKSLNGKIYAVSGNWAIKNGLMIAGPHNYIDESTRPKNEVGCMCYLRWLYNLRDLPIEMITDKGRLELERVRNLTGKSSIRPAPETLDDSNSEKLHNPRKSWLRRLFG